MHAPRSKPATRILLLGLALCLLATSLPLPASQAHPTSESWTTRAAPTPGREGAAGSFINGLFYVSHGFAGGMDATLHDVYDAAADAWTPLPQPTIPRSELVGAAAMDQRGVKHYAIGGRSNQGLCGPSFLPGSVCDTVEVYDPVTGTWGFAAPMPTARAGLGAAVINNLIYVVGGRTCGTPYCGAPLATLEIFDPMLNAWFAGPPMPTARMDVYSVAAVGGLLYVVGGSNAGELATMDVFDPSTGTWTAGAPMPTARANAIAGVCGGHVYVIGGSTSGGVNTAVVEEYDPATGAWTTAPSMPSAGSELAASAVSGPGLIMATGSGIFGAALAQNFALECDEGAASCEATGILVRETDLLGGPVGDAEAPFSRSRVQALATPGAAPTPGGPLDPPTHPDAHADAQQAGFTYSRPNLHLSASAIFSRCDVDAVTTPRGTFNQAYGRAGVADLALRACPACPPILLAEALDFEANAFGAPTGVWANEACDVAELDILPPPQTVAFCQPPNTGTSFVVLATGTQVTVTVNEEQPPVLNSAGLWEYAGAAVHVNLLQPGVSSVDVWLGQVRVAVAGPPPAAPPAWFPNGPCVSLCD